MSLLRTLHSLLVAPLSRAFSAMLAYSVDDASARLDAAVARASRKQVRSAVLWVQSPRLGFDRGFAHGIAQVETGTPMTVETPFLSASVGKLVVAAAVLRLTQDGRLSLDDPMTRWISPDILAGLPVTGGDAALPAITIAMLLGHRSGLPDYFSDPSCDGAPRLFDLLASDPTRRWNRADLLDYARAHYKPVGAPGQRFHYADTNYDLLGLVLEGVTGTSFVAAVRALVLDPLELTHTWYHAFEQPPAGQPGVADVWVNGTNLWGAPCLSADQAGGGLVTTVADLRLLLRGLVEGRPVSLAAMATDFTLDAMHSGIDVGQPAWRIRPRGIFFALAGLPTLLGHSGATGVWAYYVEDWDAVIVGAVSDASWQERHIRFLLADVLPVLARMRSDV
jgi:D-alanyl-D-alanine carboxypeptidase